MVKLSCDICGGSLIFTGDLDTLICETCGVKYSKDALKQKILRTNSNTVVNASAETIMHQSVDVEKEKMIKRAEGFVLTKQYDKAVSAYWELVDKFPDNIDFLKKYIELFINCYAEDLDHLVVAFNSLKNLTNIDILQYTNTFFNNIKNNSVDVYMMFNLFRRLSSGNYNDFKKLISNNLSKIFTHFQINEIISTGEANSKFAKQFSSTDDKPIIGNRTRCDFLIANFAFCTVSDPDWCDLHHTVEVKHYEITSDLLEKQKLINERHKSGLCLYCGGRIKGLFRSVCENCGRHNIFVTDDDIARNFNYIISRMKQ